MIKTRSDDSSEPDKRIYYFRDSKVYGDIKRMKTVRFTCDSKTVDIGITDENMIKFVEATEKVFN
jgi:hypothetical protein